MADTAVMGRMGDPAHLSAVAVGAVLFGSIYWIFGFLRMATGGLVAQALGADDAPSVARTTLRALLAASLIGLVLIVLQRPLLAAGLVLMDDAGGWQSLAATYFGIRILSAPATLAGYALLGTLVGLQRMRGVLALQLVLNLVNVALNLALYAYTDLGIAGVAIATVIAEYVALILGLWLVRDVLVEAARDPAARVRDWLFEREALLRFGRVSGDLFVRTLCLQAAFYWLAASGSRQGVEVLAANAVLVQLLYLMSYCLDGYAHAAETLTGFAVGRRDAALLERSLRSSTLLAAATAILFTLAYALGGGALVDLLTTDPDTRALARTWLPWIVATPIVGVWSFLLDGIFIGATRTANMRNSMIVSLAVFIGATLVLVPAMGNHGLWLSYHLLMLARTVTLGRHVPSLLRPAA